MKEFLEPVLKLQLFSVEDIITESAGNLEEEDNGRWGLADGSH